MTKAGDPAFIDWKNLGVEKFGIHAVLLIQPTRYYRASAHPAFTELAVKSSKTGVHLAINTLWWVR